MMSKEQELVIQILSNVYGVHLAGSRCFESKHGLKVYNDADWDLACPYDIFVIETLQSYGFGELSLFDYAYSDNNSVGILKHKDLNIECCVKYDIRLHHRVFGNMSLEFFKKYIWKSSLVFIGERSEIPQRINQLMEYWSE